MDDSALKPGATAIPQGTRTYLFEEAASKRYLEQTIHCVLRSRGFQEIVTPLMEYHESAVVGLSEEERNRIISFTEGDSGRIIALRADITSQVARSAATHLSERPLPLRLCYTGPVFRRAQKGKGEQYVTNQSGLEIIGHAGEEADIETVLSIVSALAAVGFKDYSLSLGHAGFIAAFLEGIEPAGREKIQKALGKKDQTAIKEILSSSSVPEKKITQIIALTELYGGKEVFQKASRICSSDESRQTLDNLTKIYHALCDAGIEEKVSVDLGEMRGFGYYTGINMELFSPSGISLGTGGRYDSLLKRFGSDLPAVGFGFDIDNMIEAIRKDVSVPVWRGSDILLVRGSGEAESRLRQAGLMVIAPFSEITEDQAKSFAEKMSIPHILLGGPGKEIYRWIKTESGKTGECHLADFIKNYYLKG